MNVQKCVRALLCLYFSYLFSIPHASAQALKAGDKFPEELWNISHKVVNHPAGRETLTLGEYKDKLVILEFWGTTCTPCIKSLKRLDSLQKELGEKLAVIPVTVESNGKVLSLIRKQRWSLPSIVEDTLLKKRFPYFGVPQLVWIKEGEVKAITGQYGVYEENIANMLSGEQVNMVMKELDKFDALEMIKPSTDIFLESGLIKRVKSQYSTPERRITPNGLIYCNSTIKNLFREAYSLKYPFLVVGMNRILVEMEDASKIHFPPKPNNNQEALAYEAWNNQNLFTYYVKSSKPQDRRAFYEKMQSDISLYFEQVENIRAEFEKRNILCLVIKKGQHPVSEDKQMDASRLRIFLDLNSSMPVINETGYTGKGVSPNPKEIPAEFEALKRYLAEHGLDVEQSYRQIEMMIIKDKPSQTP